MGSAACAPAEIGLQADAAPSCPDASKIGTATIKTPLLDDPLEGSIYLAAPHDNPFNALIALYLVAKGPGVIVKLPGRVEADPDTGRLTATFDDNPQLPFDSLHLEFDGGPRAPIVLPPRCGTYTTHAELTGWNGKTVDGRRAVHRRARAAGPRVCPGAGGRIGEPGAPVRRARSACASRALMPIRRSGRSSPGCPRACWLTSATSPQCTTTPPPARRQARSAA